MEYVDYLFDIQRNNLRKEMIKLLEECCVDPKRYIIFLECGGIHHVIRDLISNIYLHGLYIDRGVMLKIAIFDLVMKKDREIFRINDDIINEKNDWRKDKIKKEKEELKEKVMVEVNKLVEKFNIYRPSNLINSEINCKNERNCIDRE